MQAIEGVIKSVISQWNNDCKQSNVNQEYFLEVVVRKKKYYLNRNNFFEKNIAELRFFTKGDKTFLLWRKELNVPKKVANTPQHLVEEDLRRELYYYFLYECIGAFAIITQRTIESKDNAPYDLEKDRLVPDVSAGYDFIIKTTKPGMFYEEGQEFDVFMVTDEGYLVYTAHDLARPTGGVAKIDNDAAIVVSRGVPKLLTLEDVKDGN